MSLGTALRHEAESENAEIIFEFYAGSFECWSLAVTQSLSNCAPLVHIPAALICGAYADPVRIHEPTRRFAKLILDSTVAYTQNSNVAWCLEGADSAISVRDSLIAFLFDHKL